MSAPAAAVPATRSLLLPWLAALAVLRFALAASFGPFPQETYYFLYAQHLQLSYFDHPPAIAWLLRAFSALPVESNLAARLTALTCTAITQLAFLQLARRCGREGAALLFAGSGAVTLVSLIALPDVPLLMFWTLALVQLHRAIFEGSRGAWIAAGVLMGLAFDGKYTGAFLQVGLVAFLLVSPRGRALLRTPWPWLALAAAHVVMLPVYVWNAQHGFASFAFQTAGRASKLHGPQLRWIVNLAGSQLALLMPPLLGALVVSVAGGIRRMRSADDRELFLLCFSAPLLLLMLVVAVFLQVKPNWLLPAYVTGTLLAVDVMGPRLRAAQYALSALGHVALAVWVLTYTPPLRSDDTFYGWQELAGQVRERGAAHAGAFVFSADEYKTTAELRFHGVADVFAGNVIGERALEFDYLGEDLHALRGRDALYLDSRPRELDERPCGGAPRAVLARFATVGEEAPILIRSRGEVVRKFCVWFASGYQGP